MTLETIHEAIELNTKLGINIKCIHLSKEDLEQIKQENTSIQSEESKTTLFGYPVKEDIVTFIE